MDSYTVAQLMWAVASSLGNKNCQAAKLEIAAHLTTAPSQSVTGIRCFRRGCWHRGLGSCRAAAPEMCCHTSRCWWRRAHKEICFHSSAGGTSDPIMCQVKASLAWRRFLCKCGEALFASQPGPFSEIPESDLTGLVCSNHTTTGTQALGNIADILQQRKTSSLLGTSSILGRLLCCSDAIALVALNDCAVS